MNDVQYAELTEKLHKHEKPLELLFTWAKTGHITQKTFVKLMGVYISCHHVHENDHYW